MNKKWNKTIKSTKVSVYITENKLKNKRFFMRHPCGIAAKLFEHWVSLFIVKESKCLK